MPIESVLQAGLEADRAIGSARALLIADCMQSAGFSYAMQSIDTTAQSVHPFGFESADDAGSDTVVQQITETPQPPEYLLALYGEEGDDIDVIGPGGTTVHIPAHGCDARADDQLLGEDGRRRQLELLLLLRDLQQRAYAVTTATEPYQDAVEDWNDCMMDVGYDFADPTEVVELLAAEEQMRSHPAFLADVNCKRTTSFLSTAYELLHESELRQLDANPGVLEEYQRLLESQVDAATSILGGRDAGSG